MPRTVHSGPVTPARSAATIDAWRMDTRSADAARITGPTELLQAVPYLLGFHPRDSVVLVGLHAGTLVVTARLDLADAGDDATLAHTLQALVNGGVSALVVAVYAHAMPVGDLARQRWSSLGDRINLSAAASGCEVLDVLVVADDRWRSAWCRDAGCCGADGQPLPVAPSAFATAATVSGVVALPDRRSLEAAFDPEPAEVRGATARLIADAMARAARAAEAGQAGRCQRSDKRALFAAARKSHTRAAPRSSDTQTARFAAALAAREVFDALWLAVDDRRLDGRPLWREIARRASPPHDARAAFLFGWAAWRAGDGAMAGIAAQHALDSDPTCSPADLLLAALSHGIDPRTFPRLHRRSA